jgi:RimJ/RimL family protein N-acetyltransferase
MAEVLLRPVLEADLPVFFEHQMDPEATRMADFPARPFEAFMAHWHRHLPSPANIHRTILFDDRVAGNIVSWPQSDERLVGYWLGREFWGRGIATRALTLFLGEITHRPLFAHVAPHNVGSQRVLQKCGFAESSHRQVPDTTGDARTDELIFLLRSATQNS